MVPPSSSTAICALRASRDVARNCRDSRAAASACLRSPISACNASFAAASSSVRSRTRRSSSSGLRIASAFGTTDTRAKTVAHETIAVNSLIRPASR